MEMERRILKSIWRVKEQDYKSVSTHSTKERRKIQSNASGIVATTSQDN